MAPVTTTKLGKILKAWVGFGGYQDAQFGYGFELGGTDWSTQDFWGFWANEPNDDSTWGSLDQNNAWGKANRDLIAALVKAKATRLEELRDKPVQAIFVNDRLVSWRILEEVL
jgi:hypothetical protein